MTSQPTSPFNNSKVKYKIPIPLVLFSAPLSSLLYTSKVSALNFPLFPSKGCPFLLSCFCTPLTSSIACSTLLSRSPMAALLQTQLKGHLPCQVFFQKFLALSLSVLCYFTVSWHWPSFVCLTACLSSLYILLWRGFSVFIHSHSGQTRRIPRIIMNELTNEGIGLQKRA